MGGGALTVTGGQVGGAGPLGHDLCALAADCAGAGHVQPLCVARV